MFVSCFKEYRTMESHYGFVLVTKLFRGLRPENPSSKHAAFSSFPKLSIGREPMQCEIVSASKPYSKLFEIDFWKRRNSISCWDDLPGVLSKWLNWRTALLKTSQVTLEPLL